MSDTKTLRFEQLPDLPQSAYIRKIAADLWQRDDVIAVWLGGSFASGKADRYSDVDLRVAVPRGEIEQWHAPDFVALFHGRPLSAHTAFSDEQTALHMLVLRRTAESTAEAYDLWVQTPDRDLLQEPVIVLGCRDEAFLEKLNELKEEHRLHFGEAKPDEIRGVIVRYWDNHIKHEKVTYRNLIITTRDGMRMFGGDLLRLYFVLATGKDCGLVSIPPLTIHTITPVARTIQEHFGDEPLAIVGPPIRNRAECVAALEGISNAMSRVGRQVSEKMGFEYPEELEAAMLQSWREFRQRENL